MTDPDGDLDALDHAALLAAAKAMRAAIRAHRDASGHDLCWYHPALWSLLPDPPAARPSVPDWPQFMRGCITYRSALDRELAAAQRTTEEFEARGTPPRNDR